MENSIQSALVVGINGSVGILFASWLSKSGVTVTGVDLAPESVSEHICNEYISSDFTNSSELRGKIFGSDKYFDIVFVCLPQTAAMLSLPYLLDVMPSSSLLVDTLSVKTVYVNAFTKLLAKSNKKIEMVSLNPMFSPTLGFESNNVAVIEVLSGSLSNNFLVLLRSWGANVIPMDAEHHDMYTSTIQVATHAAIISFGLALMKSEYNIAEAKQIYTPPHSILMSLLARILTSNPEVYWDIQVNNPHAKAVRKALLESINDFSSVIESGKYSEFQRLFELSREAIEPEIDLLSKNCSNLIEIDMLKQHKGTETDC